MSDEDTNQRSDWLSGLRIRDSTDPTRRTGLGRPCPYRMVGNWIRREAWSGRAATAHRRRWSRPDGVWGWRTTSTRYWCNLIGSCVTLYRRSVSRFVCQPAKPLILGPGAQNNHARPYDSSDQKPVYASVKPAGDIGYIYALGPATGEVLDGWPVTTNGIPILVPGGEDLLFYGEIGLGSVRVGALDPIDGTETWETQIQPGRRQVQLLLDYDPNRKLLFATTLGPTVTALNAADGSIEREVEIRESGTIADTSLQNESLYILTGRTDTRLLAVDTGSDAADRELWSVTSTLGPTTGPVVAKDTVVAGLGERDENGSAETELLAVEAVDGTERWSNSRSDGPLWAGVLEFADGGRTRPEYRTARTGTPRVRSPDSISDRVRSSGT